MMSGTLLASLLIAVAVMLGFVAILRMDTAKGQVEERLEEYGAFGTALDADGPAERTLLRRSWPALSRLLSRFGLGMSLARALARADVPLTAAEYAIVILCLGMLGFVLGSLRLGPAFGLVLAMALGFLPILYVRIVYNRRRRALTEQLPDVLTLLVSGLRAGHGIMQAMGLIVEKLPAPASKEFGRVIRAVEFGLPVHRALTEMSERLAVDDLDLVVTAINIQYEMGGNLARTLETIGSTVRDRIYMLGQIRAMTAQQRLTGYLLAAFPAVLAVLILLLNPSYISQLWQPGWVRILPVAAVTLQIVGTLIIRRIVNIEV